jgi:hypothetical protein
MKLFAKAALGALMLAGATALGATPAAAHVSVGFGFGFGGYGPYYGYPGYYDASCDPRSRWYDPYRCDYYDDYDDYYGPVFIDGFWFDGGFRSRFFHGHREFFHNGGWHSGTGFHNDGFRHGGSFSGGTTGGGGFSGGTNGRGSFSGGTSGSSGSWHGGNGGSWHGGNSGSWSGSGSGGWHGGGDHHH